MYISGIKPLGSPSSAQTRPSPARTHVSPGSLSFRHRQHHWHGGFIIVYRRDTKSGSRCNLHHCFRLFLASIASHLQLSFSRLRRTGSCAARHATISRRLPDVPLHYPRSSSRQGAQGASYLVLFLTTLFHVFLGGRVMGWMCTGIIRSLRLDRCIGFGWNGGN